MRHLGYLASFVTRVTSLLMHRRLLCGRGFEDRASAQQRGRRRDLGAVSLKFSKKLQTAAVNYVRLVGKLLCLIPNFFVSVQEINADTFTCQLLFKQTFAKLNTFLGLNFLNQHTNFCKYIRFYPMTICSVAN